MSDHGARITAIERRLDGGPGTIGIDVRLARLEEDVAEIKATLSRLEPMIVSIYAQMPHLATKADVADLRAELKADLAEKPSRIYMWAVLAVLLAAYGRGLAALAVLK